MNEMYEYSDEHLLDGFVDGELDTIQEEKLFEQLASNSELRSQLRDMRAIRTAARNYAVALIPPASLTQATFGKLGFTSSVQSGISAGAITLLMSFLVQFFQKYWLPIISVIFSSVLTAIIILSLVKDSISPTTDSNQSSSAKGVSEMTPSEELQLPKSNAAGIEKSRTQLNEITSKRPQSTFAQTHSEQTLSAKPTSNFIGDRILRNKYSTDTSAAISNQSSLLSSLSSTKPIELQEYASVEKARIENPSIEIGQKAFGGNLFSIPNLPPNFSVEYRTLASRSFPDATIASKSDPWFTNMSVGLSYSINGNHSVGIEIGQEAFPQHYSGTENGKGVRYEQNFLTQWIVAAYRYRFDGIHFLGRIDPFISTSLGSTIQAWPLTRGTIGITYTPERHVAFMIGADGSLLLYPFQSKWFTTKKIGVTYGVTFSF